MLFIYIKNLIILISKYVFGGCFWNYQLYKKYAGEQTNCGALKLASTSRFAIVIQGQIICDDDFTIETIKLYRHNFPDAILILSTWSVPNNTIETLEEYDVHIIQNKPPVNPGISNINLQIVTSGSGVLAAQQLGAQFVLKTRSDQRIYHPSLETYLFNILKHYPLSSDFPGQMSRLVGVSLGTFKFRLYGVSDMFLYGHIDDMVKYWNAPLDLRTDAPDERKNTGDYTWRKTSQRRICEVYLCTEFLKSIGRTFTFTLTDSFHVFRDHFVVIDQAAIKLYWHKYTVNTDRYTDLGLFDPELTFNDWLVLYDSFDNLNIDEAILDHPVANA